ncbi:virulence-associated E family protein [Maribacter litopenaei]|uniref:Virulence-associated E family protein n=1 Tax=Maribacter litopenaei TaxID=2976127 RepID=A0ABY5YAE2_9FLAO|nr:virulence-associated E family protein [Maribacter litopenaei]UWX54901.1 virulence-associated E family protein [Maribacter litopenaei]
MKKFFRDGLDDYIYSGKINPNNKDSIILLSEKILINMEEIGSFSKSQTDMFKDLLTKSIIQIRRPYGVFSESFIRRASFIGSTNNNDILADITGNRRFLVVEALKFDFSDYSNKNELFAQGYNLYQTGFQYWFDDVEIERVNKSNENFRQVSFEEYTLDRFFEVPKTADTKLERFSATELIEIIKTLLEEKPSKELSPIEMGKALSSKGFQKQNKKYLVIRKQL